jgi:hypothetical protein
MARGSWVTALGAIDRFDSRSKSPRSMGSRRFVMSSREPAHPLPASSCMRLTRFVKVLSATAGLNEAFHTTPISLSRRLRTRRWYWNQGSVAKQTCIANPMTPGFDAYFAKY